MAIPVEEIVTTASTSAASSCATASAFGSVIRANLQILSWLAGGVIILMGLHFLGVLRVSLFYREKRAEITEVADALRALTPIRTAAGTARADDAERVEQWLNDNEIDISAIIHRIRVTGSSE